MIKKNSIILALLTALIYSPAAAKRKAPGYHLFKQAWEQEKTAGRGAIATYYQALNRGLEKEHVKVAWWRLKSLHQKYGENDFEYYVITRLLKLKWNKVLKERAAKLRPQLLKDSGLTDAELEKFLDGLRWYHINPQLTAKSWQGFVDNGPYHPAIGHRILDFLKEQDKKNRTLHSAAYLEKFRDQLKYGQFVVQKMELYFSLGHQDHAWKLALLLLAQPPEQWAKLNADSRYMHYYIMGKICQRRNQYREAYLWFRLAVNERGGQNQARHLASYMQFQLGHESLAWELIRAAGVPDQGLPAILFHVLALRVAKNSQSREFLKANRGMIAAARKKSKTKLLNLALRLAR